MNAALDGMDALLSIAQMPGGIPVVYVGIGREDNAVILAARIMALEDRELAEKLADHRREFAEGTELDDKRINDQ